MASPLEYPNRRSAAGLNSRLDGISVPLLRDVQIDGTALAFTVAVAVLAGLVFGLAPAFQARSAALHESLKDATRGSTEGAAGGGFAARSWCPRSPSRACCWWRPGCSFEV